MSLNPGPTNTNVSELNVSCLNARSAASISNKYDKPLLIQDFIVDNNVNICFLTESWLTPDTPASVLNLLTPENYSIQHVPRSTGRGGGIAAIYKSIFNISTVTSRSFTTF